MIYSIGIDSVDIQRFAHWASRPDHILQRIFSLEEIIYCKKDPLKSAERFALRYATREAFFKALTHAYPDHQIPFLTVCTAITITKDRNLAPQVTVAWNNITCPQYHVLMSATHTAQTATAIILLQ